MVPHAGLTFDGATRLADTHDAVQTQAGTATWLSEFSPLSRVRVNLSPRHGPGYCIVLDYVAL